MNSRRWKYLALLASGGFLLQLGSCGGVILQVLGQNILQSLLLQLLDGALGNTTATTA